MQQNCALEDTFPCEYAKEDPATPAPTTTRSQICAAKHSIRTGVTAIYWLHNALSNFQQNDNHVVIKSSAAERSKLCVRADQRRIDRLIGAEAKASSSSRLQADDHWSPLVPCFLTENV